MSAVMLLAISVPRGDDLHDLGFTLVVAGVKVSKTFGEFVAEQLQPHSCLPM